MPQISYKRELLSSGYVRLYFIDFKHFTIANFRRLTAVGFWRLISALSMKKLWEEIQSKIRALLVTAIVTWLLAGGSMLIQWARGLSLTNKTVLTIQLGLLIAGLVLAGLSGWLLFFQIRRQIRSLEKDLSEALKHPHRFQDDYKFDTRLGVYRHNSKPGYFCASCTPKGIESPLWERVNGWHCQIKGCEKFHYNPDYKEPPLPPQSRSRLGLTPEDLDLI